MSETTCCPEFNPAPWNEKDITWQNKLFIKDRVWCLFHIPMNFGARMHKNMTLLQAAGAVPADSDFLVLSHSDSMWGMDIYIRTLKEVPGTTPAEISGTFLTKVFEGCFRETGQWVAQMKKFVTSRGREMKDLFFYYTTCPKCAKKYGKNYVVLLAKTN
jgi:hypothetical protein